MSITDELLRPLRMRTKDMTTEEYEAIVKRTRALVYGEGLNKAESKTQPRLPIDAKLAASAFALLKR